MRVRSRSGLGCRLATPLMMLWVLPLAANAESAPASALPATFCIHQIEIGLIGGGEMRLQNSNGVVVRLSTRRRGQLLSLGADGMVIRLGA